MPDPWDQWSSFFAHLGAYLSAMFDVSNGPAWSFIRNFSCGWIALSIIRFVPEEGMKYRWKATASATFIFCMCIGELSRVMTGLALGVSPFIACVLLWLARVLHVAGGNVSKIDPTKGLT